MKNIIVATFVIIALSSTFRCEARAFFLFPFRFDYKVDKTNDGGVKTFVYDSPFSGKKFNFDYVSNWQYVPPPPPPPPIEKTFNFDLRWEHGIASGSKTSDDKIATTEAAATTSTTTQSTTTEAPTTTATAALTSASSYNSNKRFDINWNYSFDIATPPPVSKTFKWEVSKTVNHNPQDPAPSEEVTSDKIDPTTTQDR